MSLDIQNPSEQFPEIERIHPVRAIVIDNAFALNTSHKYVRLINRKDQPTNLFRNTDRGIFDTSNAIKAILDADLHGDLAKLHDEYFQQRMMYVSAERYALYDGCSVSRAEHVLHTLGHEATSLVLRHWQEQ